MGVFKRILYFVSITTALVVICAINICAAISADNILRFGIHVSAMGNMDPHFAAGSQDRAFADMVFNALLRYVPGNAPRIEPDLAEKIPEFKMVDGRQIWTIALRRGVMFHKGPKIAAHELTADDVVFSLEKSKDRRFCAYSSAYSSMTIRKTGRYGVQIIMDRPVSPILFFPKIANYGGGFIVSRKAIETMGYDGFKHHPIGTGPFAFEKYIRGKYLLLKANPMYFRGHPLLSGIKIFFLPDIKKRQKAFEKGLIDVFTGSARKGWLESFKRQDPDIIVDTHGVGEVATLYFNTRMKPMDDIRVRKAIAYGLNRQKFLDTANSGIAGSVYSPVPANFLPGGLFLSDVRMLDLEYPYDPVKARHLLAQAGYANGFVLDLVSSEKRVYKTYYSVLAAQLAKIGIRCRVKIVPHPEMHRQIRHDPRPLVIYAAWRPNADAYLTRFFYSASIIVTGSKPDTNFSCYDKIDKLIETARMEIDPDRQISMWHQAQIRILSDMAAFPLMYTKQLYIRKKYVDYGHKLVSTMALYPQFTEKTRLNMP